MPLSSATVPDTARLPTIDELAAALPEAASPEECLALAGLAEQLGALDLQRRCLERAIALDRNCTAALLTLAALSMDLGDAALTYALLEETRRAGALPEDVRPLHQQLFAEVSGDGRLENYLRAIGRLPAGQPARTLSVLLITNLFPPQELGGYGRMMWEFAHGLAARGHRLRVLTADAKEFGKPPTPDENVLEAEVSRSLRLTGTWVGGRAVPHKDRSEVARGVRDNAATVRAALARISPDLVLAGNLDFLGVTVLKPALDAGVPVLHALANANPGYSVAEQPRTPRYWVGPCSAWNGEVFRASGFAPARVETLYPGARIDRFFRLFLPDTQKLRLCYASLMLPYKGADTLIKALARLHAAGVDFSAEIAGDAPDRAFRQEMEQLVRDCGMADKVRFTGFLDRDALSALFARSNVLVFPSRFQEPFGISQVEALAAGLVVVSSGTGGAREIIRDNVDGLLFAAGDEADLAKKLGALAQNPELLQRLQRNAQPRAITFSVDSAVLKIEGIAAELANQPAAQPRTPSLDDARQLIAAGKYAEALTVTTAFLQHDPQSWAARTMLAELALTQPDGAGQAAEILRPVLAANPDDVSARRLLAKAVGRLGQWPDAVVLLERVLKSDPRNRSAAIELAHAYEKNHQLPAAESLLRQEVSTHQHAAAALALGDLLKRQGRLDEALQWHRQASGSPLGLLPSVVGSPRHAVFIVQQGLAWPCMASLYQAVRDDPAWRVTVVGVPFLHTHFTHDDERNRVFSFLEEEGIPYVRWDAFKLAPGCADVAFLNLPYEETLPAGWRLDDLLRAAPRLVYLPYAWVIVGGTENTSYQFNLPLQQRAWMVVAHSERNRAMFTQHCATGDAHVVVTGHPKLDALRALASARDPDLTRFAAGRKVVVWNPHFDVRPDGSRFGSGCSTFLGWYEFLLEEFARRPGMAFIIRPHPLFFSSLESRKLWSSDAASAFQTRIASAHNVTIDRRPSYLAALASADALISDASSLLIEYGVTGNPLLYLKNPRGPGLNEDGEFVRDYGYTAESSAEIVSFLDRVARGDDPRAAARRAAFPRFVHQPETTVALSIKAAVTARLDRERTAAAAATS